MTTRKIMVRPCIVKISLYASAVTTWPLGLASWARISSASLPPTRKKVNDVTPYRIPIRLWSTVVIQLHQPDVAFGRANTRRRDAMPSGWVATVAMRRAAPPSARSLQAIQILDESVDLVLREHGAPRPPARTDVHVVA